MRYKNEEKEMMSISDVCKIHHITRQAIFVAIKNKRLKAKKTGGQWRLEYDELEKYLATKYDRMHSKYDGELLYNPKIGEISVKQATNLLGLGKHQIYHAIRTYRLPHTRKGAAYILKIDDVKNYLPKDKRKFRDQVDD